MEARRTPDAARVQLAENGVRARRPARLASVVVEELTQQIVSGALPDGAVLPTEPALCEHFRFSRTVIREGLKLLEERGLVRVEQGRGTTVQPRSAWDMLDPVVLQIALAHDHDMTLISDLIAVRRALEQEMARAAATRLTEADLHALEENVEQMAAAYDSYDRFRSLDTAFHTIVMRASGNEIGLTIVRTLHRYGDALAALASEPAARSELTRTVAEHRAVLDALIARDGPLAAERISAHIEFAWAERRDSGRRAGA